VNPITEMNTELALDKQLGVANVRLEFPWRFIETGNNVYDWTRADAIVSAANAAGVAIQPVLVWTPSWISSDPAASPTASQFSAFVTALVNRYKGSIHAWEMWNEPDLSTRYWDSGEPSYVSNILIPGYQAVHAADPTARVILGGPSSANTTWLNGIYSNGGGSSFDIMAFHDYGGTSQIAADAQTVQGVLNSHSQGTKPIWLGEYGAQENTVTDTTQQNLLKYILTQPMPIAMAQWYSLRDQYSTTCCPPAVAATGYWGLVMHDDVTKKNGFATMQSLLH
jgi:Cellulase (glycosyl hydrolase family 5)